MNYETSESNTNITDYMYMHFVFGQQKDRYYNFRRYVFYGLSAASNS